ncbi:DNA polymerase beta superfamily protein [Myxosarcina sp. GI1]|uniref:nucleotidyltransferase domain-containing protein n=1 Tax=Myxosarcina sp. GI1 TaxID=1541065 RepID=UPI000563C954|nr:nucleotidyltransferase domain-containing protein [Myxosarcina sp. GI1]
MNPHLIIPVGTQVVSRIEVRDKHNQILCLQGGLGVITQAPTDNSHSYQIRLPNERQITLRRHQFSIRKHYQRGLEYAQDMLAEYNLYDYVIYRCVVGSKAFGLDNEDSDTDLRGIYLPPADLHWSLYGIPEQLENNERQECYWELQKFIILALKANPNILECLYTPMVETATAIAEKLLANKEIFLSQLVYQTYNGYVMSQFKKMEQDLRNMQEIRPKHAMHLIRLLLSGITILERGFVPVKVDDYRSELLAIRNGEMSWEEVNKWRLDLHQKFDRAKFNSTLPERPDYEKANSLLIKARRKMCDRF